MNEVNTHREQVLALEKAGSHLRFASLKQDVVLIKNLLLSVQARWDKLVQRSLDRGRHLDEARKRAKQVLNGYILVDGGFTGNGKLRDSHKRHCQTVMTDNKSRMRTLDSFGKRSTITSFR